MSMLRDQRDLLCAFNAEGVEYLVVGGNAVNIYGVPRLTKDLDVFIRSSPENSQKVFRPGSYPVRSASSRYYGSRFLWGPGGHVSDWR